MIEDVLSYFVIETVWVCRLLGVNCTHVYFCVFRTLACSFVYSLALGLRYSLNLGEGVIRSLDTIFSISSSLMVTVSELFAGSL